MTEESKKRLAFILVLAILIVSGSFYFYDQKNKNNEITISPSTSSDAAAGMNKSEKAELVVYISGAVNKPGLIRVPAGSRVADAVEYAGGFAPGADASKVNLAKMMKDGMHVDIPVEKAAADKRTGTDSHNSARQSQHNSTVSLSSGKQVININYADKTELDKLPGIGPSLAERIVEYRQENGSFQDLNDLKNVPGIGDAKFNQIKDKISL